MKALKPCGTRAAYMRHARAHEPVCDDCNAENRRVTRAHNEAKRQLRELYPKEFATLRALEIPEKAGWMDAVSALIRKHRKQYREIVKGLLAEGEAS